MSEQLLKFRIEYITSEEDCDEIIGKIDHEKKTLDIIHMEKDGSKTYKGFVPFSAIKKLEIVKQASLEDFEEESEDSE